MKKLSYIFFTIMLLSLSFTACNKDEGNYNYLSDEEVSLIKFDTTGMESVEQNILNKTMKPGDKITFRMKVKYTHPERLRFRWFVVPHPYAAIQVGNSKVYPEADTIATSLELNEWECNLKPGMWRFYCMAEDTENGLRSFYQAQPQYVQVSQEGTISGLYLLTETADGNTDIEVMGGSLLMTADNANYPKYYSSITGRTLPGKPRFIKGASTGTGSYVAKDCYMVCTDQNLYRLSEVGLQTMNEWNNLFYSTPEVFNPQGYMMVNNCNFLINDGKLHVLYIGKENTNDGLFSAPINGDYDASGYLMAETKTTWRPVTGAINADQVIFDQAHKQFRPYYKQASSISRFKSTDGDAFADANRVQGEVVQVLAAGSHCTYVIAKDEEGAYSLSRFNFYNRVDNGDLSIGSNRAVITLAGATDIDKAKFYTACASASSAFYYATDQAVHSFAPARGSGDISSREVFTAPAGETITCIYATGSHSAGFPWATSMLYIATWDGTQGKVYQFEMDHSEGVTTVMWSSMMGGYSENPSVVTTGWGKVCSMTWLTAE